jgi:hypothetical protein
MIKSHELLVLLFFLISNISALTSIPFYQKGCKGLKYAFKASTYQTCLMFSPCAPSARQLHDSWIKLFVLVYAERRSFISIFSWTNREKLIQYEPL